MMERTNLPVKREDDGELLGFVAKDPTSWTARTIFGYVIARADTQTSAASIVRSKGLSILKGMWRFQDTDGEWYPCVLKETYENRVIVIRTNELGFQDPEHYKLVTIKDPSESNLVKA